MASTTNKRTGPLSRTEIARAALAMVDRDGVEKFSMRRLSQELGVTTMAVYHHFENKAEILQAAADQAWIEALAAVEPIDDPVEMIIQGMLTTRRTFRKHMEITPYAFASPTTEGAVHVMALGFTEQFERAGFRGARVGDAYFAITTYAFGSGLLDAERSMLDYRIRHAVSDLDDLVPEGVATDERESYRSVRDAMRDDPDLVRFERGLRTIMAGLLDRYASSSEQ